MWFDGSKEKKGQQLQKYKTLNTVLDTCRVLREMTASIPNTHDLKRAK